MKFDPEETLRLATFLLERQSHLGPCRAATWEKEAWDDYQAAAHLLKQMHERIAELEAELVAEAKKTASEKLRADQMTEQHRMQATMHSQAREELAALKAPAPIPSNSAELAPATPWYPDKSGDWIEGSPNVLPNETLVSEWLYAVERSEERYTRSIRPAQAKYIPVDAGPLSVVAYKVVKP